MGFPELMQLKKVLTTSSDPVKENPRYARSKASSASIFNRYCCLQSRFAQDIVFPDELESSIGDARFSNPTGRQANCCPNDRILSSPEGFSSVTTRQADVVNVINEKGKI